MTEAVTGKLPEIGFPKERIQLLEKQYINDITKTVVLTGGRAYRSFLRRGRKQLPERFEGLGHTLEGGNFAEWMKRSDGAANNFVRNLYDTTVSGKAIELAMENPAQADHGIPHLRRVEEWFEQAIFNDKEIRHSKLPFKFWLPAAYLGSREGSTFGGTCRATSGKGCQQENGREQPEKKTEPSHVQSRLPVIHEEQQPAHHLRRPISLPLTAHPLR